MVNIYDYKLNAIIIIVLILFYISNERINILHKPLNYNFISEFRIKNLKLET